MQTSGDMRPHMDPRDIYKALLELSPNVVVCLSSDRRILEFNTEAERLYGVKREDVLGKDYFVLFLPPEIWESVDADMKKVMSGMPSRGFESPVITQEGKKCVVSWSVNQVINSKGEAAGIIAIGQDITVSKQYEEQMTKLKKLQNMTVTDELTGLFNSFGFQALAEKEFKLANRNKRRISLLLLDLNNLRSISDMFGPVNVELAIKDTAKIIRKSFRESDVIGRIGEDAFAILITDSAEAGIENVIRHHIKTNLKNLSELAGRAFMLQFSMGMAHYDPNSPCSLSELTSRAEAFLRQDKKRLDLTKEIWQSSDMEKRKFTRFEVDNTIVAKLDGEGAFQIKDISTGGVCIRTMKLLPLNSTYKVTLFNLARFKITPIGAVVWSSAGEHTENSYWCETGIKFVKIHDRDKKQLERLYEQSCI